MSCTGTEREGQWVMVFGIALLLLSIVFGIVSFLISANYYAVGTIVEMNC